MVLDGAVMAQPEMVSVPLISKVDEPAENVPDEQVRPALAVMDREPGFQVAPAIVMRPDVVREVALVVPTIPELRVSMAGVKLLAMLKVSVVESVEDMVRLE